MAHVLTHQASVVAATMLVHVLGSDGLKGSVDEVASVAGTAVSCAASRLSVCRASCTDRPAATAAPSAKTTLRSGMPTA